MNKVVAFLLVLLMVALALAGCAKPPAAPARTHGRAGPTHGRAGPTHGRTGRTCHRARSQRGHFGRPC